jgi:hypothetical protein
MNINYLGPFIKKALEHYDAQKLKYKELIHTDDVYISQNIDDGIVFFPNGKNKETFDYELLGYMDNNEKIWVWSWVLTNVDPELSLMSRDILKYGIDLDPKSNTLEHFMLKSLLVNSRSVIDENTQLDVNLAIFSFILKEKIHFIYPRRRLIDKNKYNTFYYLIKKI